MKKLSVGLGVTHDLEIFEKSINGNTLFDFEKLDVYQKIREANVLLLKHLYQSDEMDEHLKEQLKRSSLSVMLNLSEGVGRTTNADKKRFITMARSSLFETVAILQILQDLDQFPRDMYDTLYGEYTSVSKMLLAMFRSYTDKKF